MTRQLTRLERRIRCSGMVVAIGLIAELISLLWNHPIAFFLFLGAGASLMCAGILFYFYSLVTTKEPPPEAGAPQMEEP
jgi:hypothetical protein